MIKAGAEVEVRDPPTDGISAVKFGPCSDSLLLSSSWDSVNRHCIIHRMFMRF